MAKIIKSIVIDDIIGRDMEEFEKRMVLEYNELEERTDKLNAFLNYDKNAEKRKSICEGQLEQMHKQLWAMKAYCDALCARLQMRGICFNGCDLDELKGGLALFMKLPHINSNKVVTFDSWGYVPSLYYFDGSWVVDWLHSEDGDSLVSFSADTPEEAIQKAYDFSMKEVVWGDSSD